MVHESETKAPLTNSWIDHILHVRCCPCTTVIQICEIGRTFSKSLAHWTESSRFKSKIDEWMNKRMNENGPYNNQVNKEEGPFIKPRFPTQKKHSKIMKHMHPWKFTKLGPLQKLLICGVTFILLSLVFLHFTKFLGPRQRHKLTSVSTQYIRHGDLGGV